MSFLIRIVFIFISLHSICQINISKEKDTVDYVLFEKDSTNQAMVDLDPINIFNEIKFDKKDARRRYLILKRKIRKVYPYARLAKVRMDSLENRLEYIDKKRHQKKYIKRSQKYLEKQFSERLKKLSRTEGQLLVKLIYRQTGIKVFDLIKMYRSGVRAFLYNTTASMFDISLKIGYDPIGTREDYYIENILRVAFQNGKLEFQEPAIPIEYININ